MEIDIDKLLVIIGLLLVLLVGYFSYWAINDDIKRNNYLKECYYDKNSHSDCSFVMYKYEHRTNSYTTVMPVVVR